MSYAGILDFIKGNKHEKIDAENIALNKNGQAVEIPNPMATHTHVIPTDHFHECPVCRKPLFSIKTQAWSDVPGMFTSSSSLFVCGNEDCSFYGLVRAMA